MEAQRLATENARSANLAANDLTTRARAAAEVAAAHAPDVDLTGRFPTEAFAEIRKQRLLGILVPQALNGEGASLAELADVCFVLGQACSSAALIFAMHHIKMACIIRHAQGNAALERILR
ncbi:MAG TPA: acyl-CoA dehydrogenase family protein, partial [Steroidobacteraceae bacterium]|nr:acyl-CoA dehydrogenase family protein [Steroidobacteraceae bacterium]